jgi:leucyl/phenylalanyl-tRNA--protein transferase
MVRLIGWALETGLSLIDVQMLTPHLASMGAVEVGREEYLRLVAEAAEGGGRREEGGVRRPRSPGGFENG